MKKNLNRVIYLSVAVSILIFSCKKTETPIGGKPDSIATITSVSQDIINKLKSAGFDTSEGLRSFKNGFIVEYDIFLTEAQIDELTPNNKKNTKELSIKHYTSNNLVGGPRTISVYMDPVFDSFMQNSLDEALNRYNSLNLKLKFQRTDYPDYNSMIIDDFYEESPTLGFSAGFPFLGEPARVITLNTYHFNSSTQRADAATVIAHEIGHAIGFRHTDYMNRTFSCGKGGSEGAGQDGAFYIPGTPSGPSAESWMLACSSNTNRPFTKEDIVALLNTYPFQYPDGTLLRYYDFPEVWVHFGGAQFQVPSSQDIEQVYGGWGNVQNITGFLTFYWISSVPRNGTILREQSGDKVYYIEDGLKRWITSETSLNLYGGWSSVRVIHNSGLSSFPLGANMP